MSVEMLDELQGAETMEGDSMVESIREECRQVISFERKQHRVTQMNKNRATLGDIVENADYTVQFVIEKATALKKKTLDTRDYLRLQNALIQSEENVNAFLKVHNILFALVRDLSGHNTSAQLCAANCCCNIALGNIKACTALSKFVIPYLMLELESLNCPLLEVCVWTIGNLASGSPKACEILYAQGCIKYFISLFNESHETVIASVIYAAMHFVRAAFNQISESELIELTRAAVKINFLHDNPDYIWLLALLSSSAACCVHIYSVLPTVIDCLYRYVRNEDSKPIEVTACVRTLANTMCDCPEEITYTLLKNLKYSEEDLLEALKKLLSHRCKHVRNETLWLLGNLFKHESPNVHKIVSSIVSYLTLANEAGSSIG